MKLSARVGNLEKEVSIEPVEGAPGKWRVFIDGGERLVDAQRLGPTTWSFLLGDLHLTVDVEPAKEGELHVDVHGTVVPMKLVDARRRALEKAQEAVAAPPGKAAVLAPMSGKVVKVLAKLGETVSAGQAVVVVEAMKMENEIRAPRAGTVHTVHVKEGEAVEGQEALITIE